MLLKVGYYRGEGSVRVIKLIKGATAIDLGGINRLIKKRSGLRLSEVTDSVLKVHANICSLALIVISRNQFDAA